ncbi:hypothetical protein OOK58_42120 [Streptomyces sp. NBC_01728]|uniref:hypothetical protein n=1 Tax=unclassified Streptomyces TaxID=2593676 RepID=UPI00225A1FE2|nr:MULTISPECIES: hypothetical protein [unclassified Streptomyces]MCX4458512.1 hypothetical protein [Streptomyces sp. NBC_01719]MCX4497869.1 hypothetical protein [Streptomyces sp. NBC_01728]
MAEVTDHRTLLQLLGEWVTVTHPSAPHRVWHGQLASLMDCPSVVLQMPEGGTEVLPQSFNVVADAPASGGPYPDPATEARSFAQLRDSGLLWLINRVALHPRGLALALHLDEHGQAYGWSLVINLEGEPWQFDPATDNDGFVRAEQTIAGALKDCAAPFAAVRCCVCGGGPGTYENFRNQPFCAGCANCDCGLDVCARSRPDAVRTPADGRPGTDIQAPGRARMPVLGKAATSADTVRTRQDADTSGRPDADVGDGPAVAAWGNCCERAEALRADLATAVAAYEALRVRTITTSKYVQQQQLAGFPFRGGDHRQRILDRLAVWTDDPGPLKLASVTASEAS